MSPTLREHSLWVETKLPQYPALDRDLEVDVVVVGAGLTGITAAYLLREAGVRVAVIERASVAAGDTARTTAHLTYVTDLRLHEVVQKFGRDAAQAFWEAGEAAIDEIARIVRETQADCDFRWVPGYLHRAAGEGDSKELERLEQDAALARELGFKAELMERVPWADQPGIQFAHQAKFHPRKYLAALLKGIPGEGSHVFENTALEEVQETPFGVKANGRTIRCQYLIIATHNPLMGRRGMLNATLFQTKLALYTSYVLGARLPKDTLPEALFWDTSDPYEYLRVDRHEDHDYAIFGGEDVKTGQEKDTREVFARLEARLKRRLPTATVEHRWMGQVIETDDGLPFIGENAEREFIATGFCGNGFTLGTLSAVMARDRYLKRKNPWFELFRVDRRPFHGGLWRYVRENLDYPYYLLRDRLARAPVGGGLDTLPRGDGRILAVDGHKVAAYRDEEGKLSLCSPVCTHLKCLVRWNTADKTWDCPCHGSRFRPTGEVLSGPAEEPLKPFEARAPASMGEN
jgi:glycine/D-amino acid oxidase-like deaminating enzyme/nitrite reductase/ring-hydroxylating ferredoxin subunit